VKEQLDISVAIRRTEILRPDGMATQNESFSVAGFFEEDNECADAYNVGNTFDSLRDCQLIRTLFS